MVEWELISFIISKVSDKNVCLLWKFHFQLNWWLNILSWLNILYLNNNVKQSKIFFYFWTWENFESPPVELVHLKWIYASVNRSPEPYIIHTPHATRRLDLDKWRARTFMRPLFVLLGTYSTACCCNQVIFVLIISWLDIYDLLICCSRKPSYPIGFHNRRNSC